MTLRFFWIAEYNNKKIFPQFDFETGYENQYADIEFDKLIKFGWYSFPFDLAQKVKDSVGSHKLERYVINIRPSDKLFVRRRVHIQKQGRNEKRFIKYLLGNQDFVMFIDEDGSCEIKYDKK